MSDGDELRAALDAVQLKLESAEGEAAKVRTRVREVQRQREDQESELRRLRSQMHTAIQRKELESMRAQLTVQKQVLEGLENAQKRRAVGSIIQESQADWKESARRSGSARGFAFFGYSLIVGSIWWASQGFEGALCIAALGALFAAPWLIMLLL